MPIPAAPTQKPATNIVKTNGPYIYDDALIGYDTVSLPFSSFFSLIIILLFSISYFSFPLFLSVSFLFNYFNFLWRCILTRHHSLFPTQLLKRGSNQSVLLPLLVVFSNSVPLLISFLAMYVHYYIIIIINTVIMTISNINNHYKIINPF